jgi:hypothetical protein
MIKTYKYPYLNNSIILPTLRTICLITLRLCTPVSLVVSRRYYPVTPTPPPPPPSGGGGGRFRGFPPNSRPPGGPSRGGAQGGNPSDKAPAPYQGPKPARSHSGARSSLLYQDKNLTVKAVKTPVTEKFTEIENSGKAVEVLTRGFVKLKSTAKTSSTASSPSSSQNRPAEDKENGSKKTSYNQGRSSRPCSSTSKQKPTSREKEVHLPSNNNTDVQNTSKDAVNSASAPSPSAGPGYTLASSSSSADSVDVAAPLVLWGGSPTNKATSYPKGEYTAAAGAALLQHFKINGHPLNAQLEEQIKQFVPNNVTPTSKLWENMSLQRLEDSFKHGSKEERIYRGLHFLEACKLISVTETSGDKIEPRFYNHCKPSICSPHKTQLNLAEETFAQMSANLWIGSLNEPTPSDTVLLLPEHLHVHLFWNVGPEHPGQPQRVLSAGFFTSRGDKDTLVSPTQPFGGNKPQYFNISANPVVMGIEDVSVLSNPTDIQTAATYLNQVRPILEYRIKQKLFPLLKDPISLYSKKGLTLDHMDTAIHDIIQKEESELKLWLNDYNKKPFDKERNNLCSDVEKKKIDHPIAHKLFFHILNNANEKTTPITPNIT